MNCKHCGAENPVEAVYCQNCGKRLDGKIPCPVCQTMNAEEANFCISCGAKLNEKKTCAECGTVFEGNYCPTFGKCSIAPARSAQEKTGNSVWGATVKPRWKWIVELVGGGLAMAAVLFSLIFTCLIGVKLDASAPLTGTKISVGEIGIFDFFGKIYDGLGGIGSGADSYDETYRLMYYYSAAWGTAIAAAAIVCVLTFSILAIVRFVKSLQGSERPYTGFAVAATVSYLAGCVGLHAINAMTMSQAESGITVSVSMELDATTVAGIVLVCVFLAGHIGCRIACNAKSIVQNKGIVPLCLSAACTLLFAIALGFAGGVLSSVDTTAYGKMGGGYRFMMMYASLTHRQEYLGDPHTQFDYGVFGMPVQIVLLTMLTLALAVSVRNLTVEEGKSNLAYAIVAEVFSVIHLVIVILVWQAFADALRYEGRYHAVVGADVSYALAICMVVFVTLSLVASIVHAVYLNRQKKAGATEQ